MAGFAILDCYLSMEIVLRGYQELALTDAFDFLSFAKPGDRRLYAAPTGTGKSLIELAVLDVMPDAWLVTPRVEIIAGMLAKLGVPQSWSVGRLRQSGGETRVVKAAEGFRITTPTRLRNRLMKGEGSAPRYLVIDESHHDTADTYSQLRLLCGDCPAVGFTATPYRGTPQGTKQLLDSWGDPVWVITYPEAAANGFLSVPACRVAPLVDDDVITVSNGEFTVQAAEDAVGDRLQAIADLATPWRDGLLWDRPTVFSLPGVATCRQLAGILNAAGRGAAAVTGETPARDRQLLFDQCVKRHVALCQVQVISEGVDLPLRRLVDAAPTLSPVKWVQQLGRITRPVAAGEPAPEYICTNRNLLRHAYLLEGCIPARTVAEACEAFGGLGQRLGLRVLGLEALGRFKGVELPLADGSAGLMYCMSQYDGTRTHEYACLLHPARLDALWASRANTGAQESRKYGKWCRCDAPEGLQGFSSLPAAPTTEKQCAWWKRSAKRYGLDPEATVNRRNFAALPVLSDLGVRL